MSQSTKKMGTLEKLNGTPAGLPLRLNTGQDLQAEVTLSGNKIISFCTSDEAQQLVQAKLGEDDEMKLDEDLLQNQDYSFNKHEESTVKANKIRRRVNFSELVSDDQQLN